MAARLMYQPFHTICHQLANRSFQLLGEPLAVCMRCSSVYLAFLLGTILYLPARAIRPLLYERRALLIASVIPMCVDVLLDTLGLHPSNAMTRMVTGSLFGIVVPFYVIPAAQAGVQELLVSSRLFTPSLTKKGPLHA